MSATSRVAKTSSAAAESAGEHSRLPQQGPKHTWYVCTNPLVTLLLLAGPVAPGSRSLLSVRLMSASAAISSARFWAAPLTNWEPSMGTILNTVFW